MDARLVSDILYDMSYEADHEELWWRRDGSNEGSRVVIKVHDDEWESHSGLHTLDTNAIPVFRNKPWTYFIVEPIAEMRFGSRRTPIILIFKKDEGAREFIELLNRFKEIPARHFGYRVPGVTAKMALRAGLQWFAWWVNGEYSEGNPAAVLYVRAPATEREAAEWLAEWLEEKIPVYLAESL